MYKCREGPTLVKCGGHFSKVAHATLVNQKTHFSKVLHLALLRRAAPSVGPWVPYSDRLCYGSPLESAPACKPGICSFLSSSILGGAPKRHNGGVAHERAGPIFTERTHAHALVQWGPVSLRSLTILRSFATRCAQVSRRYDYKGNVETTPQYQCGKVYQTGPLHESMLRRYRGVGPNKPNRTARCHGRHYEFQQGLC